MPSTNRSSTTATVLTFARAMMPAAYLFGLGMTILMGAMWIACPALAADGYSLKAKEQIAAGVALYKNRCAQCHSENLTGGAGPPLRGEDFVMQWDGKPMRALYSRILMTMPGDDPGSLTAAQVLKLVSYIASENSLADWKSPFESPNALNPIVMRNPK